MVDIGVSFCQKAVDCKKRLPELIRTIEAGSLANLDFFEGDWTFHRRKKDPFVWETPSQNLLRPDQIEFTLSNKRMEALLQRRPPKVISFHLGSSAKCLVKAPPDNHNKAIGDVWSDEEIFETFCLSLQIIRESFLTSELHLPIALENLDYHPGGAYEYICQPDFIKNIFSENPDLYLLLDIAHAEISAMAWLGNNPGDRVAITKQYLRLLPLDRLIEIHINSPRFENGKAMDMHLPISDIEIEILKWLLSLDLPNFRIINIECGQEIEEQCLKIKRLL